MCPDLKATWKKLKGIYATSPFTADIVVRAWKQSHHNMHMHMHSYNLCTEIFPVCFLLVYICILLLDASLSQELERIDQMQLTSATRFKFGVLYTRDGQVNEDDIFSNRKFTDIFLYCYNAPDTITTTLLPFCSLTTKCLSP